MSRLTLTGRRERRGRREPTGPSAPAVPGLLLGAPVSAPVPGRPAAWWALDERGRDVVVQRVRPAGGTGAGLAGLDEAHLRRALPHPHLVPLIAVVRCREGAVQVLGPAPGGSLADLLAAGGGLRPGEVSTLVAGVGTALAVLHEEGLVHGEVDAAGVFLDARGMPLLLGWGTARPVPARRAEVRRRELRAAAAGASREVSPAADVRALARLGLAALGEPSATWTGADAALHAVLVQAADADPAHVPAADQLARDCWEAVPALPLGSGPPALDGPAAAHAVTQRIRLGALRAGRPSADPGGGGARPPGGRAAWSARWFGARLARRPARWAAAAVAVAAVIAAAAVLVVGLPGSGEAASASSTTAPTAAPAAGAAASELGPPADPRLTGDDPAAAVHALASLRTEAITRADPALLAAVDVAGSSAARHDAALLASLGDERVDGLVVRVLSAEAERSSADSTWVDVVTQASAHRRVVGTTVTDVLEGQRVSSRLLLRRDGGSWKVADTA